jgi:hypothetical protein
MPVASGKSRGSRAALAPTSVRHSPRPKRPFGVRLSLPAEIEKTDTASVVKTLRPLSLRCFARWEFPELRWHARFHLEQVRRAEDTRTNP